MCFPEKTEKICGKKWHAEIAGCNFDSGGANVLDGTETINHSLFLYVRSS
jgi:hypothetical protein